MTIKWKKKELGELASFYSGGTPSKSNLQYWGGDIPWITVRDIKEMRYTKSTLSLTEEGAATLRIMPAKAIYILVRGMGLFKDLPVLICDRPATFNQDIKAIIPKTGVDPEFFAYSIIARKSHILRLVDSAGHGTGRLDTDQLKSVAFLIPQPDEQRAIAKILRTWDEAIENLLRLSELRKKQYLGLRHHLIDWSKNQHAVKEFLKPVSRPVSKPTSGYRALSIRSHGKGTFDRHVENPESIEMDTLYVVKSGDIIVNITFAWEGAVALVPRDHDGCLVSHRFPTFVPKMERVDARYLRHALRMARFTYLLGIVSPGGAGRNRVLAL
jgi:type I restriction enzyme S subunit